MADNNSFFRPEIFEAKKNKWTGHVVMSRPFSFVFLTGCAAAGAAALIVFAFFGSYTRKTTVDGQLLPAAGLVRVYAPDTGFIAAKKVSDGQYVKQGDELLTLSMPRYNEGGDARAKLVREAELRKQMLLEEIEQKKTMQKGEESTVKSNVGKLEDQLADVRNQLKGQRQRVALAKKVIEKYRPLLKQGFISDQQMIEYENAHLDQKTQLGTLEREEAAIIRELEEQRQSLTSLPEKQQSELSQLSRNVSELTQETLNLDMQQEQSIRASKAGYVSTSNVEAGQQVTPSTLLLSIVPKNTDLVANLYVPSRAAGFIKPNDKVVLRYQAYPYEKFGHADGKIISIAKTAVGRQELTTLGGAVTEENVQQPAQNEPVYLVRVKLAKQTIKVYGEEKRLQTGMVVEADIMHERKKLYEWVLDPLYSITGKL
ncbi:HlyD family secretion protein [Neisseria sp.]|uniref:HlyD family secretion protein n=1 Tax=Neisseria sp. TaxID=192066 RepID=UPI0035A00406